SSARGPAARPRSPPRGIHPAASAARMPSVAAPGLGELEPRLGRWRADPRAALAGLLESQPDAGLDPTTFATGAAKGLAGAVMRGDSPGARKLIGLLRRVAPAVARGIDRLPDVRVATNVESLPSNVAGRYMPPFRISASERQKWPGGFLQLGPARYGVHETPASLLETLAHEGTH